MSVNESNYQHRFPARFLPKLPRRLKDASPAIVELLLIKKLEKCSVPLTFDIDCPLDNLYGKRVKLSVLREVLSFLTSEDIERSRAAISTPSIYCAVMKMFSVNVFRDLSPSPFPASKKPKLGSLPIFSKATFKGFHLLQVYSIFLNFLETFDFQQPNSEPLIDQKFVFQLLQLFNSDIRWELDSLQIILHIIYSKFINLQAYIRKAISDIFSQFIYETDPFYKASAIASLLDFFACVITGFTCPLKEEHEEHNNFLFKVLLPLHKSSSLSEYHRQLFNCIIPFLEADSSLKLPVILTIIKFWPKTDSSKEIRFLDGLEIILNISGPEEISTIAKPVFQQLVKCISSPHFLVAERALNFWKKNYYFVILIEENPTVIFPFLLPLLNLDHWDENVQKMIQEVLTLTKEINQKLFEELAIPWLLAKKHSRLPTLKRTTSQWNTPSTSKSPPELLPRNKIVWNRSPEKYDIEFWEEDFVKGTRGTEEQKQEAGQEAEATQLSLE